MKKTIILFTLLAAISTWLIAAEKKEGATGKGSGHEHKFVTPADIQWGEAPAGLPPGAQMAVLAGDPTKPGMFTVRLKTPANYTIAPHTHPTDELVTCISGSARLGMGEKIDEAALKPAGPGSFVVLPAGMAHYVIMNEETVVQIHGQGPFKIKYVNPADDPRAKTETPKR